VLCPWLFPVANVTPWLLCVVGVLPLAIGCYLLRSGSRQFNKANTTFYLEKPAAFVYDGMFRYSRNPMYLGALLFVSGVALLTGNLVAMIAPVLFFGGINFLCIPPEEKIMKHTFGQAYLNYKNSVRRWI